MAVNEMLNNRNDYFVILMDIEMPLVDGLTATTIIKKDLSIRR